jgi:hypothetical protein
MLAQNISDITPANDDDVPIIITSKSGPIRPSSPYYNLALWLAPELTVDDKHKTA